MALEKELETYRKELPRLLAEEGRFALIRGDRVAGTFSTYADALQAGYAKFSLSPFLVKRIEAVERVLFFTRDLTPSCPT